MAYSHDNQRAARRSAMSQGPQKFGSYAWWFLTDEEKIAYASWKESPGSGEQSVLAGIGGQDLPKNWLLLEEGSVEGVADRDVGLPGQHYLAAASDAMAAGGTARVWRAWAMEHGITIAEDATVT